MDSRVASHPFRRRPDRAAGRRKAAKWWTLPHLAPRPFPQVAASPPHRPDPEGRPVRGFFLKEETVKSPHPLETVEIDLDIQLRGELAKRVLEHAERLRIEPQEMLADIIEFAINEDLVDAILDR